MVDVPSLGLSQVHAKMDTGATVMVPLFVNEGDVLKVDTRTGEYVERVKR